MTESMTGDGQTGTGSDITGMTGEGSTEGSTDDTTSSTESSSSSSTTDSGSFYGGSPWHPGGHHDLDPHTKDTPNPQTSSFHEVESPDASSATIDDGTTSG